MHGVIQFRLDGYHVYALFVAISGNQSLYPLATGQVIPVTVALDVVFHE